MPLNFRNQWPSFYIFCSSKLVSFKKYPNLCFDSIFLKYLIRDTIFSFWSKLFVFFFFVFVISKEFIDRNKKKRKRCVIQQKKNEEKLIVHIVGMHLKKSWNSNVLSTLFILWNIYYLFMCNMNFSCNDSDTVYKHCQQ